MSSSSKVLQVCSNLVRRERTASTANVTHKFCIVLSVVGHHWTETIVSPSIGFFDGSQRTPVVRKAVINEYGADAVIGRVLWIIHENEVVECTDWKARFRPPVCILFTTYNLANLLYFVTDIEPYPGSIIWGIFKKNDLKKEKFHTTLIFSPKSYLERKSLFVTLYLGFWCTKAAPWINDKKKR